jgi:DNA polymerase I
MKVTFWLLDVNYEVNEHTPEIWLWGITDSGNRVLVIDRNFLAYFYAVIEDKADPTKVVEEIEAERAQYPFIVKLEVVERKFFGKSVKAVKVYCKDPNFISNYANAFRNFEGVKGCLEDDIRCSMRYLIDNNVVPCGWHEIEVTEEANTLGVQVDKVYTAKSLPKFIEKAEVPQLRILGFSTICYSKEGSPKPDRNPIAIISVTTNKGEEEQFLAEDQNDKLILQAFVDYVQNFDPDLIVGFGVNRKEWHYLNERCKKLGLKLSVDRVGTEPHRSVYGHVSITGRANIDVFDFADEFPEVKVKTLENLADYLGVMKIENRVLIEDVDFADYWDDEENRENLKKFSIDNTRCIMGITDAILDFAMQLSNLVSLPLDHVGTAAVGFRVEWFLVKHAHKIGELVPKRIQKPYRRYAGAIVLKPEPGLHENIAVLDFKCHPAGTLVITKQHLVPIERVRPGDYVLGYQGWVRIREIHNYPYSGDLIKVKSEGGKELLSTPNHRLLVWNCGLKEVEAKDVSLGQKVIETVDIPMFGVGEKISERDLAMAEFLGLFYAEGYMLKKDAPYFSKERGKVRVSHQHRVTITISRNEANLRHELNKLVYLLWNEHANWLDEKNKGRATLLLQKKHIWEEFHETLQNLVSFLLMNEQLIRAFLKGFFEGDGYINSARRSVVLPQSEKNYGKLQLVEYILKVLGIKATVSPRLRVISGGKKYYKRHLEIIGRRDLEIFKDKVGFISNRKYNQLVACLNSYVRNKSPLSIPINNQKGNVRVILRRIKDVKRVKYHGFVYDLTVEDENTPYYFANFLLTHNSMYPNIMITYNLSQDTYVSPREPIPACGVYEAPEVKHRFRKEPAGFYKEVLSYLIKVRDEIRLKMKKVAPESVEYRVLDARQKAVKVITNASYGYAGWIGARWYVKPVAEAATAWGRHTILTAIKMAEKAGLKIVYSDTDSLFIKHEPEKIEKLSKEIKEKLGLEIKPDKVYVRIFFTEAKKRYAGLLPDGRLDIAGLEVVRGDWAAIAKKVQEKVLEIILKEQSPKKAAKFVQQFIYELWQRRVPYRDLIIWKTLTKPVDEYAVRASHVEAAKMLKEKGWRLTVGDKVGYVVVVGSGRLYERVKPYVFASYDEIDIEYYVSKQVVPAAVRVLESFGITEEQLLKSRMKERETRRLTDFFGS